MNPITTEFLGPGFDPGEMLEVKKGKEAVECLEGAAFRENLRSLLREAFTALYKSDAGLARRSAEHLVRVIPEEAENWRLLSSFLNKSGKLEESRELMNAVAIHPRLAAELENEARTQPRNPVPG